VENPRKTSMVGAGVLLFSGAGHLQELHGARRARRPYAWGGNAMQKSVYAASSARDGLARVLGGRRFSGWRIPLPGRLPTVSDPAPKSVKETSQKDEFRHDLHHFLAARSTVPGKNGRN